MWAPSRDSFAITLLPGVYFVPWHMGKEELRELSSMVACGVKISTILSMNERALTAAIDQGLVFPDVLIVLDVRRAEGRVEEMEALARGLRAPFVLLKWPEPLPEGYGWLERFVKAPLMRALLDWVSSANHPLASIHIERLPVVDAAALTASPVELLHLLEAAIEHRLSNANHGLSERAYVQSLYMAAGDKITAKLVAREDIPSEPVTEESFERAGLAHRILGDLRLGPLLRATGDLRVAGAWARAAGNAAAASLAKIAEPQRINKGALRGIIEAMPTVGSAETLLKREYLRWFNHLVSLERPTVFDLGEMLLGLLRMERWPNRTPLPAPWRAFALLLIASLLAALADPDGVLDHAPEALTICEAHASEAWADKGAALASALAGDARAALA